MCKVPEPELVSGQVLLASFWIQERPEPVHGHYSVVDPAIAANVAVSEAREAAVEAAGEEKSPAQVPETYTQVSCQVSCFVSASLSSNRLETYLLNVLHRPLLVRRGLRNWNRNTVPLGSSLMRSPTPLKTISPMVREVLPFAMA